MYINYINYENEKLYILNWLLVSLFHLAICESLAV